MVSIYTLSDPRTGEVRYVGQTHRPLKFRYWAHVNPRPQDRTHNANWIKHLRKDGLRPIIELIEEVPDEEWVLWEKYWIAQFKCWGFRLNNHSFGGDSEKGVVLSNESMRKLREGCKKRKISKEERDKFGARWKGKKRSRESVLKSVETRKKLGCFNISEATKEKVRKAKLGKPLLKRRVKILQYDKEDNFIKEWSGIVEASKELKLLHGSIDNCLAGKTKTAGGFKWKYKQINN